MGPEEELKLYDKENKWNLIFQKIENEEQIKYDYSLKTSRKPEFCNRNRYGDVNPYDHSRVTLEKNNIDYINANLVKVKATNRTYILTQGPLPYTSSHFWLMVWEKNSNTILMLNKIIENGQIKCHPYYPTSPRQELIFQDVGLKVKFVEELESNNHFIISSFILQSLETNETKRGVHFHYTAWPDFGVPQSTSAFLNFLFSVRKNGVLDDPLKLPIIHCSAGIGRSGTFCLVDSCLLQIEKERGNDSEINILDTLLEMRSYRMGLIQTPEQLRFSYLAIVDGSKRLGFNKKKINSKNYIPNIQSDYDVFHCSKKTENNFEKQDKSPSFENSNNNSNKDNDNIDKILSNTKEKKIDKINSMSVQKQETKADEEYSDAVELPDISIRTSLEDSIMMQNLFNSRSDYRICNDKTNKLCVPYPNKPPTHPLTVNHHDSMASDYYLRSFSILGRKNSSSVDSSWEVIETLQPHHQTTGNVSAKNNRIYRESQIIPISRVVDNSPEDDDYLKLISTNSDNSIVLPQELDSNFSDLYSNTSYPQKIFEETKTSIKNKNPVVTDSKSRHSQRVARTAELIAQMRNRQIASEQNKASLFGTIVGWPYIGPLVAGLLAAGIYGIYIKGGIQ